MKMKWLACLALMLGACPSVTVDANEGALAPTVEFDPANKIIPFPNNLLLDPATGKLALPEQCNESPASALTRAGTLNKLDGFGTYETAINITFTEPVDMTTLDGNVLLFQRARGATGLDPLTAQPLPVVFIPGKTVRFTNQTDIKNCSSPTMVDQITMVARIPLEQKSTYTVAVLDGVKTASGKAFNPSFTWSLVREPEPVVVVDAAGNITTNRTPLDPTKAADKAQLEGIDLLWNAHHQLVSFLAGAGHQSATLLLAFEFNTQTTTDPLDPAVAGSPASTPTALPLLGNVSQSSNAAVTARASVFGQCVADDPIPDSECFLRVLLGGGNYARGKATCAAAGCAAISNVIGSILLSKQYQVDITNTKYTGTGSLPIPGPWNDPLKPTVIHNTNNATPLANDVQAQVSVLVLLPQGAVPANGYPTVIFQHGITRSRGDVFGIAGALTSNGFAVVAIDVAAHGSRAVRISNAANLDSDLDCSDVTVAFPSARPDLGPDPTAHTNCYAPIFSTDLAGTRDNFRQGLLDQQQLVTSLVACGTTNCGALKVDATKIYYVGHSLGGIYGSMTLGMSAGIRAGVLNVAGAGWVDILQNTQQTEGFQCPLVDGLIDAGFLTCGAAPCTAADKFNKAANTGLCLTDAWKTDPGYIQFTVIGRWVLDSADPANFNTKLAPKKFLLQRVANDEVVPNIATDNLGALIAQTRADASCGVPNGAPPPAFLPSAALLGAPTTSHFLNYLTVPPGTSSCPPGNTFTHGTLLAPTGRCATTTTTICNPREPVLAKNGCPNAEVCNSSNDGSLATARLQTDAVFFLKSN